MLVIKDAMVVIHLAKLGILKVTASIFTIHIPVQVKHEIMRGKGPDVTLIQNSIAAKDITVQSPKQELIKKANEFNLQGGEASAVALYWQENADLLATDDDNVRKKKLILDIRVIGTPALLLSLFQKRLITKEKALACISELSNIAWFSQAVLDKMIMEVEDDRGNWNKTR